MDLTWFRLADIRKRKLDASVWIPLLAVDTIVRVGKYGHAGFEEEFFGAASLAVPLAQRALAEKLDWHSLGISNANAPYTEAGRYVASDQYEDLHTGLTGVRLVIDQRGNGDEFSEWHLHQDLVVALGLRREGDHWVAIHEGYVEVARLMRSTAGGPKRLEIRAEFLKDYLAARGMALYVSWYHNRVRVVPPADDIEWVNEVKEEEVELERWSGRASEIHEGGMAFGAETAVFHASRTDVTSDEDVPLLGDPGSGTIDSKSWTIRDEGAKMLRIQGEVWKREWVEPAPNSPRVKGDDSTIRVNFIVDAAGARETQDTLRKGGRWLWFKPEVIPALIQRRGGGLQWYTRQTGGVRASPDYNVHFGINEIGLVVAYAKDVCYLPEWQQRLWAAHNVSPEGGISDELHASQVRAEPADTLAPEAFLQSALTDLDGVAAQQLGIQILREHEKTKQILEKTHRFRALDEAGLFALAKDVARLTADSIDAGALQTVVPPPKGERWGSLKSLEKVIAKSTTDERARAIVGPLVAAYELRHGDAHLASDLREALTLAGINSSLPFVHQGEQLLSSVVSALVLASKAMSTAQKVHSLGG